MDGSAPSLRIDAVAIRLRHWFRNSKPGMGLHIPVNGSEHWAMQKRHHVRDLYAPAFPG